MTQRRTTKRKRVAADIDRHEQAEIDRNDGVKRKARKSAVAERERFLRDLASIPGVTVRRY